MSEESTADGPTANPRPGPPPADTDVPVGDMFEEGETEIGPHPSLTHLENLDQADLEAVAKEIQADPDADT